MKIISLRSIVDKAKHFFFNSKSSTGGWSVSVTGLLLYDNTRGAT